VIELERIRLKGFKSVREMGLELRDLNILIGANGSGKSNFASFFRLLKQLFAKQLQVYIGVSGGADALLYLGRKTTQLISSELLLACGRYAFSLMPAVRDSLIVVDEDWNFPPMPRGYAISGYSEEARFPDEARSQKGTPGHNLIERSRSWGPFHFHDTSESAKVRQTCDIRDNDYLRPDGSNLAACLYLLGEKHRRHYEDIVDAVRMVAPFFDDFNLRPSRLNDKKIRLEWQEKGWDAYLGPETSSDGTLRFICLATLLLQPNLPSLIVIDEPELGLHPSALALLASLLKSASTRAQVIACTQSVTLVNQFEPADIIVVDREEGPSAFRRLSQEQTERWLDRYGLGDLWEKNILGGRI